MSPAPPFLKFSSGLLQTLALTAGLVCCLPLPSLGQLPSWLPPHVDANGKTLDAIVYPHPSAYFTGVTAIAFNVREAAFCRRVRVNIEVR